ncbi:MAG: DUF1643 domain-containing protein [Candidatus Gastranaerophilales bacterium]|nr:DUF1643 domain-containing protein [Candidatus Gastranaerophilales bacterium]
MNEDNNLISLEGCLNDGEYITRAYFCKEYTKNDKKEYAISDNQWNSLLVPNNKEAYKEFKANKYDESKGKRYKYRPYFKAIKIGVEPETKNILTFIMFNPSKTHQYSLDDTVNNCMTLAKNNSYDGFEVLNLLNIRNPKIDNINICDIDSNKDCTIKPEPICQNVVFAWGSRNFCKRGMNILNINLQNFLKYCNKDTKIYTLIKNITRHPGRQAWRGNNGFRAAKLHEFKVTSFDKLKIFKCGNVEK